MTLNVLGWVQPTDFWSGHSVGCTHQDGRQECLPHLRFRLCGTDSYTWMVMGSTTALKTPSWFTASKAILWRPLVSVLQVKVQFPLASVGAVPMIIPSSSTATWAFADATPLNVGVAMVL